MRGLCHLFASVVHHDTARVKFEKPRSEMAAIRAKWLQNTARLIYRQAYITFSTELC